MFYNKNVILQLDLHTKRIYAQTLTGCEVE